MVPDQQLIDRLLRRLAREYPKHIEISALGNLDTPASQRALFYLFEKGLVEPGYVSERPGQPREMLEAKITSRGLETLQGVNGQPSQSAASPIPFEIEALRHFIKRAVEGAAVPAATKQRAVERLMAFSEADVKSLLVRLVQKLSEHPAVIVELIENTGK